MTDSAMTKSNTVTAPKPGSGVAPWRVRPQDRSALLEWFERANLDDPAVLETVRQFVGGRVYAEPPTWTPIQAEDARAWRSLETGRWPVPERASTADFRAHLEKIRARFSLVKKGLHARLAGARGSAADLTATVAPLLDLLEDVDLGYARTGYGGIYVAWPLAQSSRSSSFAGELAYAFWLRTLNAKSSVLCPYCQEFEIFEDARLRRTCGKERCVAKWRHDHKPDEDLAAVAERNRRWRAAKRRAKEAAGGKTRKR